MIILKEYQRQAVDELKSASISLLNMDKDGKMIVMKGPTGSGKTVVATKYIEEMSDMDDYDLCYLWVSIGAGNLHEQSKNKINSLLDGSPSCKLLEEVIPDGEIGKNQVVVVNWEKLNRKKNDEWDNVIMRNGEKTNFHDVIGKTLEKRKIILIIDESHLSTNTRTSQELRNIINPDITFFMSATPEYIPPQNHKHEKYVEIDIEDVIREGVIKKEILINDELEEALLTSEQSEEILETVLELSIRRREELKEAYKKEGKDINPLCLIQIPNAEKGEETLNRLTELLEKKGISVKDDNLAIWLSGRSENLDKIDDFDSKVDFLIFKMAVATGWDCPRAQVLLKLREVKSEVFDIQTVGRILRMPEREHYGNELLNKAYIYTNNDSIVVKMENLNGIVKWIKSEIREGLKNVSLTSYYVRDESNILIYRDMLDEIFLKVLEGDTGLSLDKTRAENEKVLEEKGISLDWSETKGYVAGRTVLDARDIDKDDDEEEPDKKANNLLVSVSARDVEKIYTDILQSASPRFYESFKSLWIKTVIQLFHMNPMEKQLETKIKRFLINNRALLEPVFIQTTTIYTDAYKKSGKRISEETYSSFSIKEPNIHSDEGVEKCPYSNYIFTSCYLNTDRSAPEKNFEEVLGSAGEDKVSWWYKNGENSKEHFGIKYLYGGAPHTFYPDYIVRFADGSLGLYETKAEKDRDGKTITKAKAEALQPYMEKESERLNIPVRGGIIVSSDKNNIRINDNAVYELYTDNPGAWKIFTL